MDQLQRSALIRANAAIGVAVHDGVTAAHRKTFRDLAVGLARASAVDELGLFQDHSELREFSAKAAMLGDSVWVNSDVAQLVASFIASIAPVSILDQIARF